MKKRKTAWAAGILSAVMLSVPALPAFAVAEGPGPAAPPPEGIVCWPSTEMTELRGEYKTANFTLLEENGNTVRYWYENTGNTDVTIRLYTIEPEAKWYEWEQVSRQVVPPGQAWYRTYTFTGNASTDVGDPTRVFHFTIDPATGASYLNGTFRARQIAGDEG